MTTWVVTLVVCLLSSRGFYDSVLLLLHHFAHRHEKLMKDILMHSPPSMQRNQPKENGESLDQQPEQGTCAAVPFNVPEDLPVHRDCDSAPTAVNEAPIIQQDTHIHSTVTQPPMDVERAEADTNCIQITNSPEKVLDNHETTILTLHEELRRQNQRCQTLEELLDSERKSKTELATQLLDEQGKVCATKQALAQLKQSNKKTETDLTQSLRHMESEITRLKNQISANRSEAETWKQRCGVAEEATGKSQVSLTEAENKLHTAEDVAAQLRHQVEILCSRVSAEQVAKKTLTEEASKWKLECANLEKKVVQLKLDSAELAQFRAEVVEVGRFQTALDEARELRSEVEQLRAYVELLKAHQRSQTTENDEENVKMKKQIVALQEEMENLETKLTHRAEKARATNNELYFQKQLVAAFDTKLKERESALVQLQTRLGIVDTQFLQSPMPTIPVNDHTTLPPLPPLPPPPALRDVLPWDLPQAYTAPVQQSRARYEDKDPPSMFSTLFSKVQIPFSSLRSDETLVEPAGRDALRGCTSICEQPRYEGLHSSPAETRTIPPMQPIVSHPDTQTPSIASSTSPVAAHCTFPVVHATPRGMTQSPTPRFNSDQLPLQLNPRPISPTPNPRTPLLPTPPFMVPSNQFHANVPTHYRTLPQGRRFTVNGDSYLYQEGSIFKKRR